MSEEMITQASVALGLTLAVALVPWLLGAVILRILDGYWEKSFLSWLTGVTAMLVGGGALWLSWNLAGAILQAIQ